MTDQQIRVRNAIRKHGTFGKLRRRIDATTSFYEADTKWIPSVQSDVQLSGLMAQGDMLIDIDISQIEGQGVGFPIVFGDFFQINGSDWSVQGAFPLYVFGVLTCYTLHLRGGN